MSHRLHFATAPWLVNKKEMGSHQKIKWNKILPEKKIKGPSYE